MNSRKVRIAASVLAADLCRLGEQVQEAERAGADCFHIDVMDGVFVPNISFGPSMVKTMRRLTALPLLVHLMIIRPERYLADFASAGADAISVHQEDNPNLHRTLQQIRALGAKAGIVLNPATPVGSLSEILENVDSVLLMTVNPGFGGQEFIDSMLGKVQRMRQVLDEGRCSADLEVDGGIDLRTAPRVVSAGANVLVAGSAVFNASVTIREAIGRLRQSIRDGCGAEESGKPVLS